ncbi:hypothetical protein PVK06_012020 [Gossypium arboreum]|uniref:Uncharacterized protein n=1 Tax=Gossypium arboreum TaxID=29729 RepID=A0ABR0QAG1_GOSAR|nr:hypothetical protein PVK06_012020 [Gossypium arboreum]
MHFSTPLTIGSLQNVSVDDMKERISAKIVGRCGRRISRLFYKFLVSTNPIKFTEIELVDDDDVDTMVTLYCCDRSWRWTVCGIDIDLNAPPAYDNLNLGPRLQIHLVVIEADADGDDVYDNNGSSYHEVEDFSDPNQDVVPNDIDDEDADKDGNVNKSLVRNLN